MSLLGTDATRAWLEERLGPLVLFEIDGVPDQKVGSKKRAKNHSG